MKILLIDDTQVHLDAGKQTLVGHDVTYCATHEEAVNLLNPQYDKPRQRALLDQYKAEGLKFNEYYDRALNETRLPYWDVVLTDLLMPAGPMAQGGPGCEHVGREMAVGWALAFKAAKYGAKQVAVVTDMNHHHHPASAMLDALDGHFFTVDSTRMLLTNHVGLVGIAGSEGVCPKCSGTGKETHGENVYKCYECDGGGRAFLKKGKNWANILDRLMKGATEE